jgi:hypothetical protein
MYSTLRHHLTALHTTLQKILDLSLGMDTSAGAHRIAEMLRTRRGLVQTCETHLHEVRDLAGDMDTAIQTDRCCAELGTRCKKLYALIMAQQKQLLSHLQERRDELSTQMRKVSSHGKAAVCYTRQSHLGMQA